MTIRKIDEIIKLGSHPLEEHFDIEERSTEIVLTKRNTELEPYDSYDHKDEEIEKDYQMIMDSALDMVDRLKEHIDGGAEAKFLARLSEVAGQQLNIALSAAEKKAKLKDNKDKFNHRKATAPGTKNITHNNTIIVADRNAMLNEILNSGNVIDGEVVEVKEITKE